MEIFTIYAYYIIFCLVGAIVGGVYIMYRLFTGDFYKYIKEDDWGANILQALINIGAGIAGFVFFFISLLAIGIAIYLLLDNWFIRDLADYKNWH